MNRDKQFNKQFFRDGVSQSDRFLQELGSDYITVEERDHQDLISFAQKFAECLKFYDDSNQVDGDWSSFFAGDVEEMVAYINHPESFADDESKLNWLSQPHLVLFFTFLELLRYPQEQFKQLNPRYLNFYYQDVLKLTEKSEVADQVHTILELASGIDSHLLEKGTLINGGQDSEGNDLTYAVTEDLVINQAQVASLKNIFIWQKYTSLKDIHQPNKSNRSFEKMLRSAVGSPNQGDSLPNFEGTEVDLDFINDLYQEIKELYIDDITEARRNYILNQLFFTTVDDFKYCLEVHYRQINNNDPELELPTKTEWDQVYQLVEKAYRKKINYQRRNVLEQERLNPKYADNNDAFKGMMRLALGTPDPGNPLPELPSRFQGLDDLFTSILSALAPEDPVEIIEQPEHQVMEFDRYIIEVPYSATLNPNQFTISCWVKVTGGRGNYRSPVASRGASGTKGYLFYAANNNKWQFWLGKRNSNRWATIVGSDVVLNTWTHLAGTYDGSKMKFYINGELTGNELAVNFEANPTYPLVIGARNLDQNCRLPGRISEVCIWNVARTGVEIQADMNQRLTGQESGLVGYWALDVINEDTQQVLDRSGNNNHGNVNGASIVDDPDFSMIRLIENQPTKNELDAAVVKYIKEELYLSLPDFQKIISTKDKANSTDEEWQEVYRLLEKAQTRKRNFTYPPIGKIKVENIYANAVVDAPEGEVIEAKRFTTFANVTNITQSQDYSIGFAIASPILALNEGRRSITLTLACQDNTLNPDIFPENPEQQLILFDIYLSSEQEWIKVIEPIMRVGDFILEPELKSYNIQLSLDSTSLICSTTQDTFVENDLNNFLVFEDGKIYRIIQQLSEGEVQLELVGQSDSPPDTVKQYSPSGIYPHSLQFQFNLGDKLDPITAIKSEQAVDEIAVDSPAVKILLRPEDRGGIARYYDKLQSIRFAKATIKVDVQDIQDLQLRNDNSILDSKSPFNPFGNYPKVGSSFYFSNTEIIHKKLASLTLNLQWMGLPADFGTHYLAYSSSGVVSSAIANDSFQASLHLLNNRRWVEIEDNKAIFNLDGDTLKADAALSYLNFDLQDYTVSNSPENIDTDDPFEQSRYFKLELENQDFVQDLYPVVLNKIALSTDENLKSLTVYPPYTPEIKSISLGYTASVEIDLSKPDNKPNPNQIWQLHPFGYGEIRTFKPDDITDNQDNYYYLLPQYPETAALYIGIRNLTPPQNLSLLMQMVAGSGQIELAQPQIHWSYLSGEYWRDFKETEILADSTNGLIDTGIIRFQIPQSASQKHQLLPPGLTWLRATVSENPAAIPDILAIKTQAVSATYINQGNAAEHLNKPLPANSIQGLVTRDPVIEKIQQPYTSFGGKPQEDNRAFTIRVSERLRHKQRALTPWDYEHLVLEHFPAIYKAKCITSAMSSSNPSTAQVTVVVVPDISHTAPFFPLEPKVPFYVLKQIEDYLKQYTSPFVNLVVKNPRYQQIQYRVGVSFRAGYEPGYYRTQLNEDIKRYLSPWAYEEQADITFGSSIYSSTIIHYIEKRPYVDYVAKFKLIEQIDDREDFPNPPATYPNLAQVRSPDSILVSAPEHIIDLVTADNYDDEDFEGIGYMIINTDFVIK